LRIDPIGRIADDGLSRMPDREATPDHAENADDAESAADAEHVETRLRVRYAETDQMGVVYYANYLVWMEIGRTDFCVHAGFRYRELEESDGCAIVVSEAACRYRAPARYDDEILVRTTLSRLRRRALDFTYDIRNATTGESLAAGRTAHIVVTLATSRPRTLPDAYYRRLRPWARGHSDPLN
jgi:acyl-CoA thioester hydrolase